MREDCVNRFKGDMFSLRLDRRAVGVRDQTDLSQPSS